MLNPSAPHTTMVPSTMLNYLKSPHFFNQSAGPASRLPAFQLSGLNPSSTAPLKLQKPMCNSPLPSLLASSTPKKSNYSSSSPTDFKLMSSSPTSSPPDKSEFYEKPKLKFSVLNILADKEEVKSDRYESSCELSTKHSPQSACATGIESLSRVSAAEQISSAHPRQTENSYMTSSNSAIPVPNATRHPVSSQMIPGFNHGISSHQQLLDLMRSHLLSQGSVGQESSSMMPHMQDLLQLYGSGPGIPMQGGYAPLISGMSPHAFLSGSPGLAQNPFMHRFPISPGEFPGSLFSYGGLTGYPFRSKPRRAMLRRAVFSDAQRKGLETAFGKHAYITKPDRKELAEKLGLKDAQVKIWFQNRRMKWRNAKEREHIANGSSVSKETTRLALSSSPNHHSHENEDLSEEMQVTETLNETTSEENESCSGGEEALSEQDKLIIPTDSESSKLIISNLQMIEQNSTPFSYSLTNQTNQR